MVCFSSLFEAYEETFFEEDPAHVLPTVETCVPYVWFLLFVRVRACAASRIFLASSFAASKLMDKSSETLSIRSIRS